MKLYYPSSENKGADQLRSYCEADLRLCFRLCRLLVFPCGGSFVGVYSRCSFNYVGLLVLIYLGQDLIKGVLWQKNQNKDINKI